MSLVSTIKLKIMNLDTLHRAMLNMGLERREQQTYRWYGIWDGDKDELPEGLTEEDLGKCEVAYGIPNKKNAFEIGIRTKADGSYQLLWDLWERGGLEKYVGPEGCKLISEYEALTYKDLMAGNGYEVSEITLADGTRRVTAERYV